MQTGLALLLAAALMAAPQMEVRASEALTDQQIRELTETAGAEYNICPELLQAIAWRESNYIPDVDNGSCKGLMQVSSRWHTGRMKELGVTDLHDPVGNMMVAADYLAELFEEHEDASVVLMFYSGDSRAEDYSRGIGKMSSYVSEVLEASAALEREHGK